MLLVSTAGEDGVSWLGNAVEAGCNGAQVVGWVTFPTCVEYTSAQEFEADEGRHRVPVNSAYAWCQGVRRWAWNPTPGRHPQSRAQRSASHGVVVRAFHASVT